MPVTLGAKPGHDFDEPLGLLSDCHRRIERFLDVLLRVSESAGGGALTGEQAEALKVALRYFASAGPRHNADEEESLFPRLRALSDPRVGRVMAKIEALEAEHHHAAGQHEEVERIGRQWLEAGRLEAGQAERLSHLLKELRGMYRRHIEIEDREIFPLAAEILQAPEIARMGREMAQRRGL